MGNFLLKNILQTGKKVYYACPKADIKPNLAYHGSPYSFDFFDCTKIGLGEGCAKRGKGLYLYRTPKYAPFFANIKSKDAPPHIGYGRKLDNPTPTVYTVTGVDSLNLKQVSPKEAKAIARNQSEFEAIFPDIDGIELPSTEICVFPQGIEKLVISLKQSLSDFITAHPNYPFRQWSINTNKP